MYKILAIILIASAWLFAKDDVPDVAPGVKAPIDTLFHETLTHGIDLVYQDDFQNSFLLFDSLIAAFPDHPAPYFYKAATYQAWMSSYRINNFQKELEENIELSISMGNSLLELRKDDPWINFYVGAAYGYRAFYRMRSWNWFGAYRDGNKGIGNFKKALEKEEELYDVYLGLGTYHYWRTARSKFVAALAFWWKDLRDEGLEQMKFSIGHGRYCSPEAAMALIISLIDYDKYDRAREEMKAFNQIHDAPIISKVYLQARIAAHFEDWDAVDRHFLDILDRVSTAEYVSLGYQVECKYWLALSAHTRGDGARALTLIDEGLDHAEQRVSDIELEGPFEGVGEFKDRLKKLKKELTKK